MTSPLTNTENHDLFIARLKKSSKIGLQFIIFLNLILLFGWFLNFTFIKTNLPSILILNPIILTCFLLTSISVLLKFEETIPFENTLIANFSSLVLIFLGSLVITSFIPFNSFDWINNLLGENFLNNKISLISGIVLILFGISLYAFNNKYFKTAKFYHIFAFCAGMLALFSLVEYSYNALILNQFNDSTPLSLSTIINSLILVFSLLLARPNHGVMRIFTTPLTVSSLTRRLLIATIFIPITLGLIIALGQRFNFYDIQTSSSLLITSLILIFTSLIWWVTNFLYKDDIERIQLNENLQTKTIELEKTTKELSEKIKELEESKDKIRQLLLYQEKVREFDA